MRDLKKNLYSLFIMTDLGACNNVSGMNIERFASIFFGTQKAIGGKCHWPQQHDDGKIKKVPLAPLCRLFEETETTTDVDIATMRYILVIWKRSLLYESGPLQKFLFFSSMPVFKNNFSYQFILRKKHETDFPVEPKFNVQLHFFFISEDFGASFSKTSFDS